MYTKITGNVVKDATSKTFESGSKVINFTVAENTSYVNKHGETVEETEFVECAYWKNDVDAEDLTKGKWIGVGGFVGKRAYIKAPNTPEQEAVPVLTLRVQEIVFLEKAKAPKEVPAEPLVGSIQPVADDLPF